MGGEGGVEGQGDFRKPSNDNALFLKHFGLSRMVQQGNISWIFVSTRSRVGTFNSGSISIAQCCYI